MDAAPLSNDQADELLAAHTHLCNHIYSFITPFSLKCAVEMGIPDILHNHGKSMTLTELVASLQMNPKNTPFIHRLMRLLAHSGYLIEHKITAQENGTHEQEEEAAFVLAKHSQLLLKDSPFTIVPFLHGVLHPLFMKPFGYISDWLLKNEDDCYRSPCQKVHGMSLWDLTSHEPEFNECFNEALASDSRMVAGTLLATDEGRKLFEGLNELVDVGGGTGTLARAIADAYPHIKCINFDLPHVVAGLQGTENLSFVDGNMFEQVPPADAILLKHVMHNWGDKECVKLLQRCKEAIPDKERGGKVIILDAVLAEEEDHEALETKLFLDMVMLVNTEGKERTEKEWRKLFVDAGFSAYKIVGKLGSKSIIEVYP
ncbi:hypothetical protein Ancab_014444 [Ancistrocladus abbreviatus]